MVSQYHQTFLSPKVLFPTPVSTLPMLPPTTQVPYELAPCAVTRGLPPPDLPSLYVDQFSFLWTSSNPTFPLPVLVSHSVPSTHSSCCIFTMPSATLSIKLQVYGTLREQRQHEESLTPPWGKPVYILKQNEWRPLPARVHQVGPPFDNALLRLQFWWAVLTNSSAAPLSWAAPVCHDFSESCSHPYFPYTAFY